MQVAASTVPGSPPINKDKRGPGRPRTRLSDANPNISSLDRDRLVDIPFFEHIKSYPPEEWAERLQAYLYRHQPITDRSKTGNLNYIQKFSVPFEPDEIMKAPYGGSGVYGVIFNRWNPSTRITTKIREHVFTVMNMQYPPRVPMGEWVDDPRNKDWAWAKPMLVAEQQKQAALVGGTMATDGAELFKAAVAAVKELRPDQDPDQQHSLAAMVIQQMQRSQELTMKANDPAQMLAVVDRIINAVGSKSGDGDGVMKLVTAQLSGMQAELAAERAFNRELLMKLTTGGQKPLTIREQLEDMKGLKEVASGLFGRSGGGGGEEKGTDWGQVALGLGEKILEVSPLWVQGFMLGRAGIRKPVASVTVDGQRVVESPKNGAPGAAAAHPPTPEEQAQMIEQISNQFGEVFDEVTPFLVDQFRREMTGMDFRDWFLSDYGKRMYDALKAMSVDTIVAVIELRKTTAPDHIRRQLAELQPVERLRKFVAEFLSDAPADEDDEDDETAADAPLIDPVQEY